MAMEGELMTRRALVVGCGGTIGGAWSVAAVHALAERLAWDPREASIVQGTSAGAELATMLGAGFGVDELVDMHRGRPVDSRLAAHRGSVPPGMPPLPGVILPKVGTLGRRGGHRRWTGVAPRGGGDAGWLDRLATSVCAPGSEWLGREGVRLVAYGVGDNRRVAFTGPGEPSGNAHVSTAATLSEALRASWAIPGWMPYVEIDGETYADGGAASTASVDLIGEDEADEIYVIASMAGLGDVRGPGLGGVVEAALLRRPISRVLRREVEQVRRRGTRVVVVSPSAPELAALGPNFMDRRRREAAFASAMESTGAAVDAALEEGYAA